MFCSERHHVCRWRGDADRIDQILRDSIAGASEQKLAREAERPVQEVAAILAAHRTAPRWGSSANTRPSCAPGAHTCVWADSGDLVDELIAGYRTGRSVNDLTRSIRYSRATADRILNAHGVQRRSRSEQGTRIHLQLDEVQRQLDAGVPLTQIAAMLSVSRQWLRIRLDRASRICGSNENEAAA
jgi:hypothetical protein